MPSSLPWDRGRSRGALAPLPAVFGYKGHSLVFETGASIPAEALFLEYREASGEILTPELFPRVDGTTWVCAISTLGPVPAILPTLRLMRVRTRGSKRLPGTSRRRWPPRRSKRGKRVSGR